MLKGRKPEALAVLSKVSDEESAERECENITQTLQQGDSQQQGKIRDLLKPGLRLVLIIGITVAVLQQITGINAVFFYAPMIFEQSGIGTDAAFMQAIMVGLINLVFTVLAMMFIDRFGRRLLLIVGVSGMTLSLALLALGFNAARYTLTEESLEQLPDQGIAAQLVSIQGTTFNSDLEFQRAVEAQIGADEAQNYSADLTKAAITINPQLILLGILGFVASFAISLGPVMWVLFSEIFPNAVRGLAISFVGLINSGVSFGVQLLFPWELAALGNATTFAIYALFGLVGLILILWLVPETKGKTLEEIEQQLARDPA